MIGIRVDSNEIIATGHLMRCITIALEIRKQGDECCFFLSDEKSITRLKEYQLSYEVVNSSWQKLEEETERFKKILKERGITYLIVDSYYASQDYLESLEEVVPVLYVDDFGQISYKVSALLQYIPNHRQLEPDRYNRKNTALLRGLQYAPLRDGFSLVQEPKREKKILITTGGTDNYHVTRKLIQEMRQDRFFVNYEMNVVLGAMNRDGDVIASEVATNSNIHIFKDIKNMDELMKTSILAISASGTTLLELCATNTPTICFSIADNQVDFAKCLRERELVKYIGDVREKNDWLQDILKETKDLLRDAKERERYRENMKKSVDGKGTQRIVQFLLNDRNSSRNR